jgi:hypothetical protein
MNFGTAITLSSKLTLSPKSRRSYVNNSLSSSECEFDSDSYSDECESDYYSYE